MTLTLRLNNNEESPIDRIGDSLDELNGSTVRAEIALENFRNELLLLESPIDKSHADEYAFLHQLSKEVSSSAKTVVSKTQKVVKNALSSQKNSVKFVFGLLELSHYNYFHFLYLPTLEELEGRFENKIEADNFLSAMYETKELLESAECEIDRHVISCNLRRRR